MTNSEIIIIQLLSFNATASFNHNNHAMVKHPWVREWVGYIGERKKSSFEGYNNNISAPPKISIKAHAHISGYFARNIIMLVCNKVIIIAFDGCHTTNTLCNWTPTKMTLKKSMLIRIFIVKSKNNVGNPENIFTRLCKVVLQIYLVQLKRGKGSIKEKRERTSLSVVV